jgi:hypothetical protein
VVGRGAGKHDRSGVISYELLDKSNPLLRGKGFMKRYVSGALLMLPAAFVVGAANHLYRAQRTASTVPTDSVLLASIDKVFGRQWTLEDQKHQYDQTIDVDMFKPTESDCKQYWSENQRQIPRRERDDYDEFQRHDDEERLKKIKSDCLVRIKRDHAPMPTSARVRLNIDDPQTIVYDFKRHTYELSLHEFSDGKESFGAALIGNKLTIGYSVSLCHSLASMFTVAADTHGVIALRGVEGSRFIRVEPRNGKSATILILPMDEQHARSIRGSLNDLKKVRVEIAFDFDGIGFSEVLPECRSPLMGYEYKQLSGRTIAFRVRHEAIDLFPWTLWQTDEKGAANAGRQSR